MGMTMSSPPPGIVELQAYRTAQLGRGLNLGIVGDDNHTAGYHLGPDRTPVGDYSERLARDKAGARLFPYYASAEDSSMAWSQSRQWLAKLVTDARNGVAYTRDIREIIGSLDGKTALYWDSQTGFQAVRYLGSGHLTHTHISFFRDSAQRDQSDVLRMYLEPPTEEDDMWYHNGDIPSGFAFDKDGLLIDSEALVTVTVPPNVNLSDGGSLIISGDGLPGTRTLIRRAYNIKDDAWDVDDTLTVEPRYRAASGTKWLSKNYGKLSFGRVAFDDLDKAGGPITDRDRVAETSALSFVVAGK